MASPPGTTRAAVIAQLAPAVAHDVGNALGAARLRLQILSHGLDDAAAMHADAIRRMIDEADQGMEPLRWLASVAAETDATTSIHDAAAQAAQLVRRALRVVAASAAEPCTIDASLASMPRVLVGTRSLVGVLADLLIAADPSGRPVPIHAARDRDEVSLSLVATVPAQAISETDAHLQRQGGSVEAAGETTVHVRLRAAAIA